MTASGAMVIVSRHFWLKREGETPQGYRPDNGPSTGAGRVSSPWRGYLCQMLPCRWLVLRPAPALLTIAVLACGRGEAPPSCGLNAVLGPRVLLDEFSIPNQTLIAPPQKLPEKLVARLAVGPAYSAIVGRADSQWVIGVNGALPAKTQPSFGVLVIDKSNDTPMGVLLFEGAEVEGAPTIGTVSVGPFVVPLTGVKVDPSRIQDPSCPLFPDSLIQ